MMEGSPSPTLVALHKLFQWVHTTGNSFPQTAAIWVTLPWNAALKAQSFRSIRTIRSYVLPGNLLQHGLYCPQVCSPLPEFCSSTSVTHVHRLLSGLSPALAWIFSMNCRCISASMLLHGLQENSFFTMVCTIDHKGISALVPAAPPLSPSQLTLVSAEIFTLHVLTLLCSSCNYNHTIFFFFFFLSMLPQRVCHHF